MGAVTSGMDAFESDEPPDESQLGDSWVDHTKARPDEVARDAESDAEPDDQPLEEIAEPDAPKEYDEFGNEIDTTAETKAYQEWTEKLSRSLAEGKIPHELLKDLPVEVTVNGQPQQVTFEEMRQGYMRTADYTRSKQETYALKDRAEHILRLDQQRSQEWRDPNMLRQGLRTMRVPEDVMFKMAEDIAKEYVAFKRMSPMEQQLHVERQQLAQERQRIQQEQQMIQQQTQRRSVDAATQAAMQRINDYMPRALKAQGIGVYPRSEQLFIQNLEILCRDDGQITPERARQASIAVREEIGAERAEHAAKQAKRPRVPGGAQAATREEQVRRDASGKVPGERVIRNSKGGGALPISSSGQSGMRPSDIRNKMGY
jgi:hypothetical protein